MGRFRALIDPNARGGIETAHYALLAIILSLFMVARDILPGLEAGFWGSAQYAPSTAILHITGVRYIVHSQYWWDASSLQSVPIDDVDYLFGYGVQEPARLPGGSWATYSWVTAGYIPGSGFYSTWRAPGGGHITWYHLQYSGYTARHGGDMIGLTEWPSDPAYGNGLAGPQGAHMCISFDQAGLWWLQVGIYHPPPRPKPKPRPFPRQRWGNSVSPFWHGKLSWSASVWLKHQNLGRALDRGHYYGRGRGGYTKVRFRYGAMFLWPHLHAVKLTFHR